MRHLACVIVLLLCGCAAPGGGKEPVSGGVPLPADVFPFDAPQATFATQAGDIVTVRVEPTDAGACMWISGDFPTPRRIDWSREGADLVASDGPDRGVALLRIGAAPGATWESSGQRITFQGWQRVETPSGTYDAACIRTEAGSDDLLVAETWWFARGEGLVRYAQDRAGLFTLQMSRVH